MRKIYFILITVAVVLSSCSKGDDNGILGGNWQLNETNYLAFYTNMASIQDSRTGRTLMSRFRHTGDSIVFVLNDGVTRGMYETDGSNDTERLDPAEYPAAFQMPANFGYRIVENTGTRLVLSGSEDAVRLTLRRY